MQKIVYKSVCLSVPIHLAPLREKYNESDEYDEYDENDELFYVICIQNVLKVVK